MPHTLASLLGTLLTLTICAATALAGARRERIAASAVAAGVVASLVVQRLSARWDPIRPLAAIDLAVLAVLVSLAWRPRRGWPVWAVGFQGLTVAVDALRLAEPQITPYTYLTAVALSSYGLLAVIAFAGWMAWRERAK